MGNHIFYACICDVKPPFLFLSLSHASTKLVTSSWSPLIIWLCFKGHCFYFFFICDLSFFSDEKPWSLFSCVIPPWFRLPYPLLIAFLTLPYFSVCVFKVSFWLCLSQCTTEAFFEPGLGWWGEQLHTSVSVWLHWSPWSGPIKDTEAGKIRT